MGDSWTRTKDNNNRTIITATTTQSGLEEIENDVESDTGRLKDQERTFTDSSYPYTTSYSSSNGNIDVLGRVLFDNGTINKKILTSSKHKVITMENQVDDINEKRLPDDSTFLGDELEDNDLH